MDSSSILENTPNFDSITDDRERVIALCERSLELSNIDPINSLKLAQEAYRISTEIKFENGQSWSLDNMAYQHWHLGQNALAKEEFEQSRILMVKNNFYDNCCWHFETWGMMLWGEGKYEDAFNMIYEGIRVAEQNNVSEMSGMLYWALGVFNYDLKDYKKSLENYTRALELNQTASMSNVNTLNALSYTYIGLGCSNKWLGNREKAKEFFQKALETSTKGNQWMQEARTYYEMGLLLYDEGKLEDAEVELQKSYEMRKEHQTRPGMVSSLIALCDIAVKRNEIKKAMLYMEEALDLAIATGSRAKTFQCRHKLYELHKLEGSYAEALHHMEEYHAVRQEVVGEEASNKLKDLQTRHATEQADKEAEIQRLKNVELKKAHDLVAEKNREITDSINYARRIQNSILPSGSALNENLQEHFVLYKPKDIVAGDFYWLETVGNRVFFAVADCTGHGVPGAMVSVMCSNVLTKSVKELGIEDPGKILDKSAELLQARFSGSEEEIADGMDLGFCMIDREQRLLQFAGANNPLYLIRNNELIEIKGDKQPVGYYENRRPYTTHSIQLLAGDQIYLLTDGYSDQFGGPNEKKFKYQALKNLLVEICLKPMIEQELVLNETIENWKGELEQLDDICIIGVKFA